jgi:hypothetical protein
VSTLRELELAQVAPRLLEILRRQGVASLSEFQLEAVEKGLMRGVSQILVSHDYREAYQIAEISLLNLVTSSFRSRALVLCPNPHQAERKFQSISGKCRRLGVEVATIASKSAATREEWETGRVIIATYKSLDIAIRTRPEILDGVEYVLIDRLDLIGQPGLGARLETVLVAMMGRNTSIQYTTITPPVADVEDLAKWFDAEIIEDKKTDVKLIFSVKAFDSVGESLTDLTEFVHYRRGQVMILCGNIEAAETLALQLAGISKEKEEVSLDLRLSPEHRDDLRHLARAVIEFYPNSEMTDRLGKCVTRGVAFFHEGVSRKQRRRISNAWEDELLPVIVMPTRFAIASGLRASLVFLMGVFMQDIGKDVSQEEAVTMLSEWQLSDVIQSAGRRGLDNEGFGIVVVDNESERTRILTTYFDTNPEGDLFPRLGEVDSCMDDPENIQDLVLGQLCGSTEEDMDPFSIVNRTFWASTHRVTDISRDDLLTADETPVEDFVSMRTTKSTEKRAADIADDCVRFVSVNPMKIEGLVRSGSREMWHYVSLKSADGVACSCESWKYQGIRKHRLCKHLVKFAKYSLRDDETKPYAAGVITQSLRSLEVFGDLEKDGLIQRDGKKIRCTELGENVTFLGVPVRDARRVMKAIDSGTSDLKSIIRSVAVARADLPRDVLERVLKALPVKNVEDLLKQEKDLPGIVENCLEEIDYVNSILLKLAKGRKKTKMKKEALSMEKNLLALLETIR